MDSRTDREIMEAEYRVKVGGEFRLISGYEAQKINNVPLHVFTWRARNEGIAQSPWVEMKKVVEYDGLKYPENMLAAIHGLGKDTVWKRWRAGNREQELVRPANDRLEVHNTMRAPELDKEGLIATSSRFLELLVKHHRKIGLQNLKDGLAMQDMRARGVDDFEEAKAVRNASRLMSEAHSSYMENFRSVF